MLKKTITFEDFDGATITEDFYFNLTKAELAEMEMSEKGGLDEHMKKIVKEEDGKKLVELFKKIIMLSVGKRSEDGRLFIKNDDVRSEFAHTNAYSELFMELVGNTQSAIEFVNAIMPKDLQDDAKVKAAVDSSRTETVQLPSDGTETDEQRYDRLLKDPNWEPNGQDLQRMSRDQLQRSFARKNGAQGPA